MRERESVALFLGKELLNGGENDTAGNDLKQLPKFRTALSLDGCLAQQLRASRECSEQLSVEVGAVCKHDQRRVVHRRMQNQPAGKERHRETLARALGMPHHSRLLGPTGFDAATVASTALATA